MKWIIERTETRRQVLVVEAADEAALAAQLAQTEETDWQAQEPVVTFSAYPKGAAATVADVADSLKHLRTMLKGLLQGLNDVARQFAATENETPAED